MRLAILAPLVLSGCSALAPAALDFEAQHNSHLLQHDWMTRWSDRQPGYDMVGAAAKWEPSRSTYVKVGEYYSPECLDGRHEVFEATFGYEVRLKP